MMQLPLDRCSSILYRFSRRLARLIGDRYTLVSRRHKNSRQRRDAAGTKQKRDLQVKLMASDGSIVGPVVGDPCTLRQAGVEKVKAFPRCVNTLQRQFCRLHRGFRRLVVNGAVAYRFELYRVLAVENYLVDGVWKLVGIHAVEHHLPTATWPARDSPPASAQIIRESQYKFSPLHLSAAPPEVRETWFPPFHSTL